MHLLYFHYKGIDYLVIVDRYTNWPVVERASQGASGLISAFRRYFSTFGIAEELASDGGPEFTQHRSSWRHGAYTTACHQLHFPTVTVEQK